MWAALLVGEVAAMVGETVVLLGCLLLAAAEQYDSVGPLAGRPGAGHEPDVVNDRRAV